MASIARGMNSRFLISTGDNFYDYGVKSVDDPLWQQAFEEIFTARELMVPWHVVLGDHDHKGNVEAQVAYTALSKRWDLPARYYKRSEALGSSAAADFFYLDTTPIVHTPSTQPSPENNAAEQLDWLSRELAESRAVWKFVVGHHPVFSGGEHGSNRRMIEAVSPLLERHGVAAYIHGHDHELQHIRINGVHYLNSGAASKSERVSEIEGTLFAAAEVGYMSAHLTVDELRITFHQEDGDALHTAIVGRLLA